MTTPTLPTFYISHGAGPWPWMAAEDDKGKCVYHEDMFFGTAALSNFMFGES